MRVVSLDTETTGLDPTRDQIISVGMTEIIDRKIERTVGFHCRPTCRIDPGATAIHGIKDDDLIGEEPFGRKQMLITTFLDGADEIIIHNKAFDCGMLDAEYVKLGSVEFSKIYGSRTTCTLKMSRAKGGPRRHTLDALMAHYGVENDRGEFHGAEKDSLLLAKVWLKLTAGQEAMSLSDSAPVIQVLRTPSAFASRTVYLANEGELLAHQAFCKANKITVF